MIGRIGFVWLAVICLGLTGCSSGTVRESSAGLTAGESEGAEPDAEEELTGRYCAFIEKIDGDAIYVDLAEYITDEDTERVKELGLTEGDMPDGYYIRNPEEDITVLQLKEDTNYSFIDWNRDFLPESVLDSRYETTVKAEFQKYLDTYPNSKPGMPLFFEVKDGVVQEIYEEPMA